MAELIERLTAELKGSGSVVWGSLFSVCVLSEFVYGVISGGKLPFWQNVVNLLLRISPSAVV